MPVNRSKPWSVVRPTHETLLVFEIELAVGDNLRTLGDAETCIQNLSDRQRTSHHWSIAARMLDSALHEFAYLKPATISLKAALALDGLLATLKSNTQH